MAKTELQLEQGKLYQVYWNRKWIIAEFLRTAEPRTERYSNLYFDGKHGGVDIGPEKTRLVPRTHYWKKLDGDISPVSTPANDADIRPVTEETLLEIARLKDELKKNDLERAWLRRQLRDLTQ